MGHEQGSWMVRVLVETGGDMECEPCCTTQGRSAGIVVFSCDNSENLDGKYSALCLSGSFTSTPPLEVVSRFGLVCGWGGVDDMR